jgi:hypothetical protein
VPRPRHRWPHVRPFARLAPSRRSLAAGLGILALVAGAYALARETSLFAIRAIDVQGGSAAVDAQVRRALRPLLGTSLVGLGGGAVVGRAEALPTVVSASYDRAFPQTLRVTVVPERPAAVLRAGTGTWLVSARGRVIAPLGQKAEPALPRIWLPAHARIALGAMLPPAEGGADARAVGLAGAFAAQVGSVSDIGGPLVFHLRSGLDLLLGEPSGIHVKVAVARRAVGVLPYGTTYLDVSVPERPVAGTGPLPGTATSKPKVSTRG